MAACPSLGPSCRATAQRHGFRQMFSIDAAANEPMRELAALLGFARQRDPLDATQVIHTLAL